MPYNVVAKVMFEGVILIHCKGKMVFYLGCVIKLAWIGWCNIVVFSDKVVCVCVLNVHI